MAGVCRRLIADRILTPVDIEPANTFNQAERRPSPKDRTLNHSGPTPDVPRFRDWRAYPAHQKRAADENPRDDGLKSLQTNPPEIRKKSGERVRTSLRPRVRTQLLSSLSSSVRLAKSVHFDVNLDHIQEFFQAESPSAVSSGSSPAESSDSDMESRRPRTRPFVLEIKTPNFSADTILCRRQSPVRVERLVLSGDKESLTGVVAVDNISFEKAVVVRFTFDYWKTISEVAATFSDHESPGHQDDGCDRFTFSVKLTDQVNLPAKAMFFCVRYCANGSEYWDNNNSFNYQVDFAKKRGVIADCKSRPVNAEPLSAPTQNDPDRSFRGRYDFDASISRAIRAANSVAGDRCSQTTPVIMYRKTANR